MLHSLQPMLTTPIVAPGLGTEQRFPKREQAHHGGKQEKCRQPKRARGEGACTGHGCGAMSAAPGTNHCRYCPVAWEFGLEPFKIGIRALHYKSAGKGEGYEQTEERKL